jgi:hypothetical protein
MTFAERVRAFLGAGEKDVQAGSQGSAAEDPPKEGKPDKEKEESSATALADAQAEGFATGIAQLRSRNDIAAKGIATVGASVISGLGVAKFFDVFPYPSAIGALPAIGLGLGFGAMAIGVAGLAMTFFRLQRPILVVSDLPKAPSPSFGGLRPRKPFIRRRWPLQWPWRWEDPTSPMDLDERELKFVRDIYDRNAQLNDANNLLAYEARGNRLQRAARWLPEARAKELEKESAVIASDVYAVLKRAQHAILLDRTTRAAIRPRTWACVLAFFAGLAVATVSSDRIVSFRDEASDEIAHLKECGDAAATGVDQASDAWAGTDCPSVEPPAAPSGE